MKEKYFYNKNDININDFHEICVQQTDPKDYDYAESIVNNVVVYDGNSLRECKDSDGIKTELHHCLLKGPGVFVVKNFFHNTAVIDKNTAVFKSIILSEKISKLPKGDHFGSVETHERIWNAFEKTCAADPHAFINYYCNPLFSLICESWLGPAYQITAQVNVIKPDAKAQSAHRDYHIGFQSDESTGRFPISLQTASQLFTLQAAIAHTDMPIESGPTLLLPFSQQYDLGYMAFRNEDYIKYFDEHAVQLPLEKGDALFFNPALFHAGGENSTNDTDRIANLIQTSVAFGKPMESIDRTKMIKQLYPVLMDMTKKGIHIEELTGIISAIVDEYAFPTNLDNVQPVDGMLPGSPQELTLRALTEEWHSAVFYHHLNKLEDART